MSRIHVINGCALDDCPAFMGCLAVKMDEKSRFVPGPDCPLPESPASPVAKMSVSEKAIMSLITRADSVMDCDLSLADMQYLRKSIADLFRAHSISVTP